MRLYFLLYNFSPNFCLGLAIPIELLLVALGSVVRPAVRKQFRLRVVLFVAKDDFDVPFGQFAKKRRREGHSRALHNDGVDAYQNTSSDLLLPPYAPAY